MKYWKRSGKFLRCPRHQRRLVQGHQVATLFLYVTVYVFFLYTTASASAEGLRSTLTSEVKPSDFRPSADGVTPEDGVAGTRGKAVVFGLFGYKTMHSCVYNKTAEKQGSFDSFIACGIKCKLIR